MTRPSNGQVPSSALALVQTGHFLGRVYEIYLETATAAAWEKARAAQNGDLYLAADLGGYRNSAQQLDLHNNPAAHGSNLKPSQIRSSGSTHGWGDCLDVVEGANNAWFQVHCSEFGFVRESPAGENNHYRYESPTWEPLPVAPPAPKLYQRVPVFGGANRHASAALSSAVQLTKPAGVPISMIGVEHGPSVTVGKITSDLWYFDGTGYYSAAAMTTQTTNGLASLYPVVPPVIVPPDPPVVTPPVTTPPVVPPIVPPPVTPPVVVPPVTAPPVTEPAGTGTPITVDPPTVTPPDVKPNTTTGWVVLITGITGVVAVIVGTILGWFH